MNRVLFLILLILPAIANAQSWQPAVLDSVLDGDTFRVRFADTVDFVRLLMIDCPESHTSPKAQRDLKRLKIDSAELYARGREATEYVRSIVRPGDTLMLSFDKVRRDRYQRLLAHVWLRMETADGRRHIHLNEELLFTGHATLLVIKPNTKYYWKLKKYRRKR